MAEIMDLKNAGRADGYRYAVYTHQLVSPDGIAYPRCFIVIKSAYNVIVYFTKLHQFVGVYEGSVYRPLSSDARERMIYITQMLNYIIIDHKPVYRIDHVFRITKDMLLAFFMDYALKEKKAGGHRGCQDVEKCIIAVTGFFSRLCRKYPGYTAVSRNELYSDKKVLTRYGRQRLVSVPDFQVPVIPEPKEIFRDIPTKVFQILMNLAVRYDPDIAFAMALQAFAGLRPGEVMNVRQESSPKGPGIRLTWRGKKLVRADIDLTHEYAMRSDGVECGKIKKERKQGVYPPFLEAFQQLYESHKAFLATQTFEADYCPMFVNANGMAMTYGNYYARFQYLVDTYLRPLLLEHSDPECRIYGQMLCENKLAPHSLRHWFSVQLALRGETIDQLQFWRGDRSPESALVYLQNKGDLVRELAKTNELLASFLMEEGALWHGKD